MCGTNRNLLNLAEWQIRQGQAMRSCHLQECNHECQLGGHGQGSPRGLALGGKGG
jgi:hypothetical protein